MQRCQEILSSVLTVETNCSEFDTLKLQKFGKKYLLAFDFLHLSCYLYLSSAENRFQFWVTAQYADNWKSIQDGLTFFLSFSQQVAHTCCANFDLPW